jgi:hypothetical protein
MMSRIQEIVLIKNFFYVPILACERLNFTALQSHTVQVFCRKIIFLATVAINFSSALLTYKFQLTVWFPHCISLLQKLSFILLATCSHYEHVSH